MKKLMVAAAVAAAIGFSAQAATSWFDAGIGNYTAFGDTVTPAPTGGSWSNVSGATLAGTAPSAYLSVDTETDAPLTFTATAAKTLGTTSKAMSFSTTVTFTPYAQLSDATIDSSSKIGVIAVKTTVSEVEMLQYYGYAANAGGTANEWVALGDPVASSATTAAIAISIGSYDSGANNVNYKLTGTGIAIDVNKNVYFADANPAFQYVSYAGYGEVASLSSESEDAVSFTIADVTGATATVKVNGETVTSPYAGFAGDTLEVTYTAATDNQFADGSISFTYTGTVAEGSINTNPDGKSACIRYAKIDSVYYATLAEAIVAATGSDVITLLRANELAADATIAAGITLDIDEGSLAIPTGKTLTLNGILKCDATGSNYDNSYGSLAISSTAEIWMGNVKMFGASEAKFAIAVGTTVIQTVNVIGDRTQGMKYTISTGGAATLNGDFPHYSEDPEVVYTLDTFWFNSGSQLTAAEADEDQAKVCLKAVDSGYVIQKSGDVYAPVAGKVQVGTAVYLSLAEAVEDITEAGKTVTLLDDIDSGSFEVAYAATFDLNGMTMTIGSDDTITIGAAVTFTGAAAGKGLKNDGTIAVNADLDLSALQWGNGLVGTDLKTAKFVIAEGKTVTFQSISTGAIQNNPNAMEANLPGFLSTSEVGAKFNSGAAAYTFDGTTWYRDAQITIPTATTGLTYTGAAQTGVAAAAGYTVDNGSATDAGNYTAIATLSADAVSGIVETKWSDGTTASQNIDWSIAKAEVTISKIIDSGSVEIASGATLSTVTITNMVAKFNETEVDGAFAWDDGATVVTEAKDYPATFTPESGNFNTKSCSVNVTLKQTETPIVPGGSTEVTASSKSDAESKVSISVPSAATSAGISDSDYKNLFTKEATYNESTGKWAVEVKMSDATLEAQTNATTGAAVTTTKVIPVADLAAGTAESTMSVTSGLTPGLYYSIQVSNDISFPSEAANTIEGARVMADSKGAAELTYPTKPSTGSAFFYRTHVDAADNKVGTGE